MVWERGEVGLAVRREEKEICSQDVWEKNKT